jgi:hypothetical protein
MIHILRRVLVFTVAACLVAGAIPRPAVGAGTLRRGADSASDAAAMATENGASIVDSAVPELAFGALAATEPPDSSEFEFPDDGNKHLVRDITVWVIASAFVAYFIIKVFLEEDEDEPVDDGPPGKQI